MYRYFLKNGYSVIFLHRSKSLEPFIRQVDVGELLNGIKFQDDQHATGKSIVVFFVCLFINTISQKLIKSYINLTHFKAAHL